MLAPRILIRKFQKFHLEFTETLVLELRELLLNILDVFGPCRTPDY
jgi:hypothetical protein